jgi:hypothetical protein
MRTIPCCARAHFNDTCCMGAQRGTHWHWHTQTNVAMPWLAFGQAHAPLLVLDKLRQPTHQAMASPTVMCPYWKQGRGCRDLFHGGCFCKFHPEFFDFQDYWGHNHCHRWARGRPCKNDRGLVCTRLHMTRDEFRAKLRAVEPDNKWIGVDTKPSQTDPALPPQTSPALSQVCEDLAAELLNIKDLPSGECARALSNALAAAAASLRTAS